MKFEKIDEYKTFLKDKLSELSKQGEFDIYVHFVDVFARETNGKPKDEILSDKTMSIFANGLYLNNSSFFSVPYTSINGTSKYLGNSNTLNVDDIISYSYNNDKTNDRVVVLLAVPKKIVYKGNEIDFSSVDGVHEIFDEKFKNTVEFQEAFKDCNDLRFTKLSLLDCTLGSSVPKEYVLAAQKIYPLENKASFIENKKHLSNLEEIEKTDFNKKLENKLENIGLKDDASNAFDIMAKKSQMDNKYYTQRMLEEF
jgi:hypothetical protein